MMTVKDICLHLDGFLIDDHLSLEAACTNVVKRDPMCKDMCQCIAQSRETSCADTECGDQRLYLLCRIGFPYFEDMCPALCSCLGDRNACDAERALFIPRFPQPLPEELDNVLTP